MVFMVSSFFGALKYPKSPRLCLSICVSTYVNVESISTDNQETFLHRFNLKFAPSLVSQAEIIDLCGHFGNAKTDETSDEMRGAWLGWLGFSWLVGWWFFDFSRWEMRWDLMRCVESDVSMSSGDVTLINRWILKGEACRHGKKHTWIIWDSIRKHRVYTRGLCHKSPLSILFCK